MGCGMSEEDVRRDGAFAPREWMGAVSSATIHPPWFPLPGYLYWELVVASERPCSMPSASGTAVSMMPL